MSLYDLLSDDNKSQNATTSLVGVTIGVVTNNKDPDNLGRVRVKFPWFSDDDESEWARVASLMAGKERGLVFLPEIDDEVLVAFEQGDIRRPYVIGALWNGVDLVPKEFANDGENNVRFIKSRSGHLIKLDDTDGSEKIEILDPDAKNSIVIDTAENTVTITADKDIVLNAEQGKITLKAQDVEIVSSAATKVEAGSDMNLEASGTMTVKGATVNIN
jgi:uncharacterized protein involved in type VI secretion and phage assembly